MGRRTGIWEKEEEEGGGGSLLRLGRDWLGSLDGVGFEGGLLVLVMRGFGERVGGGEMWVSASSWSSSEEEEEEEEIKIDLERLS